MCSPAPSRYLDAQHSIAATCLAELQEEGPLTYVLAGYQIGVVLFVWTHSICLVGYRLLVE